MLSLAVRKVPSDPRGFVSWLGMISLLVTLGTLGFLSALLLARTTILAGFGLLFSARPMEKILTCLDEYDFERRVFREAHFCVGSNVSFSPFPVPSFCSWFALPAIALAEYARDTLSVDIKNVTFQFGDSASAKTLRQTPASSSCIHMVNVMISADYRLGGSRSGRSGSTSKPLGTKWSRLVARWLAWEVRVPSFAADISLRRNDTSHLRAVSLTLGTRQDPVRVPLDGRVGRVHNLPARACLHSTATPELAHIIGDWAAWLTKDGPIGGVRAENRNRVPHGHPFLHPLSKAPPSNITILTTGRADFKVLGLIPLTLSNVSVDKELTVDPSQSIDGLMSDLKFTHLDVNVLQPAKPLDPKPSSLEISAQAETSFSLPLLEPIRTPQLNISSIPQVQFTASMPSVCFSQGYDTDALAPPLVDMANISVGLQLRSDSPLYPNSNASCPARFKIFLRATSLIPNIPEAVTEKCPHTGVSLLDHTLLNYIKGHDLVVHVGKASRDYYHNDAGGHTAASLASTPPWIPALLSQLSIAVKLPIPPPPSPLVDRLRLHRVKIHLPGRGRSGLKISKEGESTSSLPTSDEPSFLSIRRSIDRDSGEEQPQRDTLIHVDAAVTAYISLPRWPFPFENNDTLAPASLAHKWQERLSIRRVNLTSSDLDEILQVYFVKAPESIIFFEGSQLGILDIDEWQVSNSTVVTEVPPDDDDDDDGFLIQTPNRPRESTDNTVHTNDPPHPYLKIQATISQAPLRVTHRRTFASLVNTLVLRRRVAHMSIEAKIGAALHITGLESSLKNGLEIESSGMAQESVAKRPDSDSLIVLTGIPASGFFSVSPGNLVRG